MIVTDGHGQVTHQLFFRHTFFRKGPIQAITACVVYRKEKERILIGVAECSRTDVYSKEAGRKLALTVALAELESKRERGEVWMAYRNRGLLVQPVQPARAAQHGWSTTGRGAGYGKV